MATTTTFEYGGRRVVLGEETLRKVGEMARMIDEDTGEPNEGDDVPFEAIYDAAVLDLMEAKAELKNAKDVAKEAKETYELAAKRLGELRKDRNRPQQLPPGRRWPPVDVYGRSRRAATR